MNAPMRHQSEGLDLSAPYLLFLGDVEHPSYAKTAYGLADWAPDLCVGEWSIGEGAVSTGLTQMNPAQARANGAKSLVIGVANSGGVLPDAWIDALIETLDAGLDIVSGLHRPLSSIPALTEAAERGGSRLVDVRVPPKDIPVGTGQKRSGKRLLTVGTDCALGKKYTALAIARGLKGRGIDAEFRATGQTGIMIAGSGMPIDAVVADFVSGAAELLSPSSAPDHVDVIEGQGSLFHPSYAAVSLGLLHGSQPDRFVVCHRPDRKKILGNESFELPSIKKVIETTIAMGRLTNPDISCAGIALNTASMDEDTAEKEMASLAARLQFPVADPIRGGERFERLLDACID